MATLTIRQLDDEVYERLRERARANHRSIEAEARQLLDDRARDLPALVEDLLDFQKRMIAKHGLLPDSTELIRELRREG
jgi:plasmid stability protein